VFCMGCGAETPPHAERCPVCGRDLGRTPGDLPRAASTPTAPTASGAPRQASAAKVLPAGPAIRPGDLDRPGFPRDTLGRSLILTAVAMSADLVVPWINLDGQQVAPSSYGLPALFVVAALGLAVLPVIRPDMRRRSLYASFPLVIGAVGFGAGAFIWLRLLYSEHTAQTFAAASGGPPAVYASDIGLYLFLIGSGVLVVAGYQVLVAAAGEEALSAYQLAHPPASPALAQTSAPLPHAPLPQLVLAQAASFSGNTAAPNAPVAAPPVTPEAESTPVVLPGTAAWTEAPQLPGFVRPSPAGGWSRQRQARR
jgi:hypothetical protein